MDDDRPCLIWGGSGDIIYTNRTKKCLHFSCMVRKKFGPVRKNHEMRHFAKLKKKLSHIKIENTIFSDDSVDRYRPALNIT